MKVSLLVRCSHLWVTLHAITVFFEANIVLFNEVSHFRGVLREGVQLSNAVQNMCYFTEIFIFA